MKLPAGLSVEELPRLTLSPTHVLMVENLQTLDGLPDLPGVVAIHTQGSGVTVPLEVPWIRNSHIIYWGDLGGSITPHGWDFVPIIEGVECSSYTTHTSDLLTTDPHRCRSNHWKEETWVVSTIKSL
ncbi:MAG: DUF2220 family protein [Actinomycetaceae bacterium]|nr:DUF2220 family protein [Actinomycetaceae bacterium]